MIFITTNLEIYFFFFEIPSFSLCLNLKTTIAAAISNIAPASYNNADGSIDLPCRMMNRLKAVIAINNGKEIEMDCCSQKTLTIAITSKYRNIKSRSANVTLWFENIVLISIPTAITVLTRITPSKTNCKVLVILSI